MLYIKALHIISMVAWFAGLFYVPRLFAYHAQSTDKISIDRFKVMEKKLYYFISTPAALLTVIFGLWMIMLDPAYLQMLWLHVKLTLVLALIFYHIYLGILLNSFAHDRNIHTPKFYKILNEIPTVFLIAIVIFAVVKPLGAV